MKKINENKNTKKYWNAIYDRQIMRGNFNVQRMLIKKVREAIVDCKTVLDIGCGNGLFVNYCKQFGYKSKGIDHSDRIIKFCNIRYGNNFIATDINTLKLKENSVDCITMLEVLEHLDNPVGIIEKAKKWCKKQLIVTVPNGDSIKSSEHVWTFIKADLEDLDFEVSTFNKDSRLLGVYNKVIDTKATNEDVKIYKNKTYE